MSYSKNIEKSLKLWEKAFKKGFTQYMVLILLKGKSMHGYEIKNRLEDMGNDIVSFKDSGIYKILKKLSKREFVTFEIEKSEKGPDRKSYTITESGEEIVQIFSNLYLDPIYKSVAGILRKTKTTK